MIQTVDFFTPIADDPYIFGQIAAANALSDVWAMGGEPLVALNIVCFPNCLDPSVLSEIMRGGADKVREAGAVLSGGHSVQDDEPKYGLAVTGIVHPDRIYRNCGCRPGDVLILTKEIGNGVINTAVKGGFASDECAARAQKVMTTLNKAAKKVSERYTVHACTDITGFGLIGHCYEMASGSGVSLEINARSVALLPEAAEFAGMGFVPAGAYSNMEYVGDEVDRGDIPDYLCDLLFDPQSSGGLLFSVPGDEAPAMYRELREAGIGTEISVIGTVTEKKEKLIFLR